MSKLQEFLALTAAMHSHLCPRQVLGVRAGLAAADLFGFDLPQQDKRLYAFVETDGCFVDGVSVTTGCSIGHRTLRLIDFGKVAVILADTLSGVAYRISPRDGVRDAALDYAPAADTSWHAQVCAYQVMSIQELLKIETVELSINLSDIISKPGLRVKCDRCGEEVMNARHFVVDADTICRGCAASDRYYRIVDRAAPELYPTE